MRWSPTGVPDWNWNWTAVRPERYIFLNILVTVPQSPRHAVLPPTGYYPLRTYYFASCTWLGIAAAPLPSPSACTPLFFLRRFPRVPFFFFLLRSFPFFSRRICASSPVCPRTVASTDGKALELVSNVCGRESELVELTQRLQQRSVCRFV